MPLDDSPILTAEDAAPFAAEDNPPIQPVSLNQLDLDALAEALTPRISAILARQVNQRRYGL